LYSKSETKVKKIIENFLNVIKPLSATLTPNGSSNCKNKPYLQDNEFLQWFVGFSDAELKRIYKRDGNIRNNIS
jgi:hypothetical protein